MAATVPGSGGAIPSIVPQQYLGDVANASAVTGLPASVVAWQIEDESSYNPNAVSPTGAQGIAQFEPGTWASYGQGSPFDPTNAFAAYDKLMSQLLHDEGGSIFNALAAYNAGEGNLSAGAGYASQILSQAGQGQGAQATPGSAQAGSPSTADISLNPLSPIINAFGGDIKKIAVRLGLVALGGALIILGIVMMNGKRLKAVIRTEAETGFM